jgi:hypothetical protein
VIILGDNARAMAESMRQTAITIWSGLKENSCGKSEYIKSKKMGTER